MSPVDLDYTHFDSKFNNPNPAFHDREWWRVESRRCGTDWSSVLRQRIRVRWWISAGRPPLAQWMRERELEAVR